MPYANRWNRRVPLSPPQVAGTIATGKSLRYNARMDTSGGTPQHTRLPTRSDAEIKAAARDCAMSCPKPRNNATHVNAYVAQLVADGWTEADANEVKDRAIEKRGLPPDEILQAIESVRTYPYHADKRIRSLTVNSDSEIVVHTGEVNWFGGHGDQFTVKKIWDQWQVTEVAAR